MNNDKNQVETISGSYTVTKMPDGQEVLMEKLTNGQWVTVEERVNESLKKVKEDSSIEFENRWKNTDTVPAKWDPQTTSKLSPKKLSLNILLNTSKTHAHLHAHLIKVLGEPSEIIKNKKLFKPIRDPSIRELIVSMIDSIDVDEWYEVLKIMNGET